MCNMCGSPGDLDWRERVPLCESWTNDVKEAVTAGSKPLKIMLISSKFFCRSMVLNGLAVDKRFNENEVQDNFATFA